MTDFLGTGTTAPGQWMPGKVTREERTTSRGPQSFVQATTGLKGKGYTEEDVARLISAKGFQKLKADMFAAGYYRKNEIPLLGGPNQSSDYDAVRRLLADANLSGGISYNRLLPIQTQAVNSGARALYWGSTPKTSGGGSGKSKIPGPTKYISITAPKTAKDNLRAAMMSALGRVPTDAEYNDYVTQLNANENKYFRQTNYDANGGQTTTGVEFDRDGFLSKYVLSKGQFQSDLSGKFGDIQDTVNQLINDNGVTNAVTANQRTAWMTQLAQGADLNTIRANIHSISKSAYNGFSDLLDSNPTMSLRDVASPYLSTYANLFEQDPNTVSIKDALSFAIGGNNQRVSLSDYEKTLKADPRYQTTKAAKAEAASMATAFARSFGVNI